MKSYAKIKRCFKNAEAFLLRDARHAMHDILRLRISAILPEAISDVGVISHLIYRFNV